MATPPVQDMPPTGGYKSFNYKRVPLKPILSAKMLFAGYVAISAGAFYIYKITERKINREDVEMRSCQFVMLPIVMAERDREYLKQIRRNRDEEAKLMANVPGWQVGTWFGEPIYKTLQPDAWVDPDYFEFYCHTNFKAAKERGLMKLWT